MEDKSALRRWMKAAREGWEAEYRQKADAAIARHVLASEAWRAAGTVFAYVSVGCEVDTRALIEAALREGKRVCACLLYTSRADDLGQSGLLPQARGNVRQLSAMKFR